MQFLNIKSYLKRVKLLTASLVFAAGASLAMAAPSMAASDLQTYSAQYTGKYKGMKITLKRDFKKLGSNQYKLSHNAKNTLANLSESSQFYLSNRAVSPIRYKQMVKYGPIKKRYDVSFNWRSKVAKDRVNNESTSLKSNTNDPMSLQIYLRQQVKAGKKGTIRVPVLRKNKVRTYTYKVGAAQTVKTAAGSFKAIPVSRVYGTSKKSQTAWFAVDKDYMLVKLRQVDDGSVYEIKLKGYSFK